MNTLMVIFGLASLQLSAAGIHIARKTCGAKYPKLAERMEEFVKNNVDACEFLEGIQIPETDYCYFKCVMQESGLFTDEQFDMYEILKLTENFVDKGDFKKIRKQLINLRGKDDCETAYFLTKALGEICVKYQQKKDEGEGIDDTLEEVVTI